MPRLGTGVANSAYMKLNSLLSHFFDVFPDARHSTDVSRKVAAGAVDCADDQPILVFRGIRYQKKQAAPNDALAEVRAKAPRIFRGTPYVPQSMPNELARPRQKAVRIFRGIVIEAD
jgi:hypothetical protein